MSASTDYDPSQRIAAAIVNWNGMQFLPMCLESVFAQRGVDLEVIVVDNGSTDGSIDYVRQNHPEAILIENRENRGYAAALNQAFDRTDAGWFWSLNNDLKVGPDCAVRLRNCIRRHGAEHCGFAQGLTRLMAEDGAPLDRLYSTGQLTCRNRIVYNRSLGLDESERLRIEEPIPGANGACAMYSREMLMDLRTDYGVFDPLFWLYGNDADLDWLAACRGWRCWYCPEAVSYHVSEGSSHVSARGCNAEYINVRFRMMLKNDRWRDALRDAPYIIKANAVDIIPKAIRDPKFAWEIITDFFRCIGPSLQSRRATNHLRDGHADRAREWMRRSTELLKEQQAKRQERVGKVKEPTSGRKNGN